MSNTPELTLNDTPFEIWYHIFEYLDLKGKIAVLQVSKACKNAVDIVNSDCYTAFAKAELKNKRIYVLPLIDSNAAWWKSAYFSFNGPFITKYQIKFVSNNLYPNEVDCDLNNGLVLTRSPAGLLLWDKDPCLPKRWSEASRIRLHSDVIKACFGENQIYALLRNRQHILSFPLANLIPSLRQATPASILTAPPVPSPPWFDASSLSDQISILDFALHPLTPSWIAMTVTTNRDTEEQQPLVVVKKGDTDPIVWKAGPRQDPTAIYVTCDFIYVAIRDQIVKLDWTMVEMQKIYHHAPGVISMSSFDLLSPGGNTNCLLASTNQQLLVYGESNGYLEHQHAHACCCLESARNEIILGQSAGSPVVRCRGIPNQINHLQDLNTSHTGHTRHFLQIVSFSATDSLYLNSKARPALALANYNNQLADHQQTFTKTV